MAPVAIVAVVPVSRDLVVVFVRFRLAVGMAVGAGEHRVINFCCKSQNEQ
jgi:hypothetical protein